MKKLPAIFILIMLVASCGGGGYQAPETVYHFFGPTEFAIDTDPLGTDGAYLYVINSAGGSLSILNTFGFDIVKTHNDDDPYDEDTLWLGKAPLDIAITPNGETLYITDAWNDVVRTMETSEPYVVQKTDLLLNAARISIVPVTIDPETYEPTVPQAWKDRHEVWFSEPAENRLLVWNHLSGEVEDEIALAAEPYDIQVSRDGDQVYLVCRDGILRVVDAATRTLLDIEVDLGGRPRRVVEGHKGNLLYVLNVDPPELHIIDKSTWLETDDEITFTWAINDMALSTDGRLGFISSDDGYLYYFFIRERRACGSSADRPYFYDKGSLSNPTMERIDTTDCITRDEIWTVTYQQEYGAWLVRGEHTGLQAGLVFTDQAYISDRGHVSFIIHEGPYHVSDGDHFKFRTRVGVTPIPVGALPVGVVTTPYQSEIEEDLVFIANSGSHTISRVYTGEDENLGAIQ